MKDKREFSATNFSALFLLYELSQPSSLWNAYFATLPSSFDTTLFWSERELAELQGSDLKHYAASRNAMVDRGYDSTISPLLTQGKLSSDGFSRDKWKVVRLFKTSYNF
jgi:hypothetical protein